MTFITLHYASRFSRRVSSSADTARRLVASLHRIHLHRKFNALSYSYTRLRRDILRLIIYDYIKHCVTFNTILPSFFFPLFPPFFFPSAPRSFIRQVTIENMSRWHNTLFQVSPMHILMRPGAEYARYLAFNVLKEYYI